MSKLNNSCPSTLITCNVFPRLQYRHLLRTLCDYSKMQNRSWLCFLSWGCEKCARGIGVKNQHRYHMRQPFLNLQRPDGTPSETWAQYLEKFEQPKAKALYCLVSHSNIVLYLAVFYCIIEHYYTCDFDIKMPLSQKKYMIQAVQIVGCISKNGK